MSDRVSLLVTSGGGPIECRQAVAHILDLMSQEAEELLVDIDVAEEASKGGPKSAVVQMHGANASKLASCWTGTIQWTFKSDSRPNHKRQNWFVGVFELPKAAAKQELKEHEVKFEAFRAGGPGGQHQNTTDSAVRATHAKSGVSVVVREGRSQHRNKAIALERLKELLATQHELNQASQSRGQHERHQQLERGNPVRRFKGPKFTEVTR